MLPIMNSDACRYNYVTNMVISHQKQQLPLNEAVTDILKIDLDNSFWMNYISVLC